MKPSETNESRLRVPRRATRPSGRGAVSRHLERGSKWPFRRSAFGGAFSGPVAGLGEAMRPRQLVSNLVTHCLLGCCLAWATVGLKPISIAAGAIGGGAIYGVGSYRAWRSAARARVEEIPDLLEQLADSMRAKGSLRLALNEVARMGPSLSRREVAKVCTLLDAGLPLDGAVQTLPSAIGLEGSKALEMALRMHIRHGANLPAALEVIARSLRQRNAVMRELDAVTAQARLSCTVLALAPGVFALLTSFLGIGGQFLLGTVQGIAVMAVGIALELSGFIWARRLCSPRW